MKATLQVIALVLASSSLLAQTQNIVYVPDNSPTTGIGNAFPFGSIGIRYQAIIPNSLFSGKITSIRDIFVAGRGTNFESIFDDIEIKMGITQQATPTTIWATNNPNPTTVYRGPLRIRFAAGKWGGIGLPKPYLYLPSSNKDNLCVEVIVWKADSHSGGSSSNFYSHLASPSQRRAFRYRWTTNQTLTPLTGTLGCKMGFLLDNGNFVVAGEGCQSSANTKLTMSGDTWPQPSKSLTVSLQGALGSSTAFMVVGTTFNPLDLQLIGAPKCFLWNDPLVPVPMMTGATGAASIKATVPANATAGTVYLHWIVLDKNANSAGLTSSDYATVIFGI